METQISTRGTELTDDLRSRVEAVMAELSARTSGLELAKFVLEERDVAKAVGLVLSWGEKQDTVVRHAEASEWDRAFKDLERRLERALEDVPTAPLEGERLVELDLSDPAKPPAG